MQKLYNLKMQLINQLEEYADNKLTMDSIKTIQVIASSLKDICEILGENEYGMSNAAYPVMNRYPNMYYNDGWSMANNNSYRNNRNYSPNSYGYDYGYSRHDALVGKLTRIANSTPDENLKRQIMMVANDIEGTNM